MGLFGSGGTKLPKWAKPYAQQGLANAQDVFSQNQGNLNELTGIASDAFKANAGGFGTSPYVDNAQGAARTISNGFFLGSNPGQSTYDRIQGIRSTGMQMGNGLMKPRPDATGDPSMGFLTRMANNNTPGAGSALLSASTGGSNPGDAFAKAVAQGQYLNQQPSAGLYSSIMSDDYLEGNPYLDSMIAQTNKSVQNQVANNFGARGLSRGYSSAMNDQLSTNLADAEGRLRYQNYNDAANRQLQAGAQSDASFGAERARMGEAAGLLSSNFNAANDRALSAGQALNSFDSTNRAQQLSAAQSLGGQFGANQDRSLEAAKASDAAQANQVQQMLTALGLTPGLEGASYAGYGPLTDLLKTAGTLPYVGLDTYGSTLANILGTTRKTSGAGIGTSIAGGLASGVGSALAKKYI